MQITGFSDVNIRLGEYPGCVNVETLPGLTGVMARAYWQGTPVLQLRQKDIMVALFAFTYDDGPEYNLPEWWQDSEILWESRYPAVDSR